MKKSLLFSLLIFITSTALGQDEKRDHVWLFGYSSFSGDSTFGGSVMDFNHDPVKISYESRSMDFDFTNASICDQGGNLLFYTNGVYIANAQGDTILNGEINPGPFNQGWTAGQALVQGALILPRPDFSDQYYLFHEELTFVGDTVFVIVPHLFYSLVDMGFQNGRVTELDRVLVEDTLDYGKITATRHANGRDWWVLVGEFDSNRYYPFLLNPEGIQPQEPQIIGIKTRSGFGQSHFSPDGSKYARLNLVTFYSNNFLDIYDFDRCRGQLDLIERIEYDTLSGSSGGLAFSQNSRFLYVCEGHYVYQYDLWESDIAASVDTVAVYDGFQSPFPTRFFMAQLAPDGKIYINCPNSVDVLHVIHRPDEKGAACQFEQHGVKLAALNAFSLPNFPNFRLGALDGNPCDTIETVAVKPELEPKDLISIFPNPAQHEITIHYKSNNELLFTLYDLSGKLLLSRTLSGSAAEKTVDISSIGNGLYLYKVFSEAGVERTGKITILK